MLHWQWPDGTSKVVCIFVARRLRTDAILTHAFERILMNLATLGNSGRSERAHEATFWCTQIFKIKPANHLPSAAINTLQF